MRGEIEAHRRELEVRLSELHEHAERAASALSVDALAREHTTDRVTDDPSGGLAGEVAALRAELGQVRDAAREHAGRNVEAGGVLDDLHRAVDDLRNEAAELQRRRATAQAQTHVLQRQLGDRTQEATHVREHALVLTHGLERVREDERGRAAALRQAEVSLRRLRASAADLGAGLERERVAHAQVAAALRSELEDQRRAQEAAAQQAQGQAADSFTQEAGLEQATITAREVGAEICDRLRGLERSVNGLGDGLRATVEHLGGPDRLPSAQTAPDDAPLRPDGPGSPEGRAAERRTVALERTARELIGTARQLRGEYEHQLASIERELGASLEREREAHARELDAVRERVEHLRREVGQADRALRTELAAEQRARCDAEQQLATERERARARERVRLELERALEVERQRAAEDRKAAAELSRALAQRVGSERQAHQELDRLRAELARDPREGPSPPEPGPGQVLSPASGPPAGDAPGGEGAAESPEAPRPDAPVEEGALKAPDSPGPRESPNSPEQRESPDSPEQREPPDSLGPRESAARGSAGPSAPSPGPHAEGGAAGPPTDVGVLPHTLSGTRSCTGPTGGVQSADTRHGDQRNGTWNGEISAARLGGAARSSVATQPFSPTSGARGTNAGAASVGEGAGTELADALTRAVQRLRDRADAQAVPPRGAHGGLRRPGEHAGGTGAPGSAPVLWPPSLAAPSRLEALRGRPRAAAPAQPTRHARPAVIPGAVEFSALSSPALRQTTCHPWLAVAIRRLAAGGNDALAGALLAELLPAQGLRCRRPLDFEIDIQGTGAFIVAADGHGRAEVVARAPQTEPASGLRVRGTPWQLAELIAGGSGRELSGLQVQGRRRVLRRLLRSRRLPVSMAELAAAGVCPWPGLLLAVLAQAVPVGWTQGENFTVAVAIRSETDQEPDSGGDAGSLRVCVRPTRGVEVLDGPPSAQASATLHVRERALFALLGGIAARGPAQALVTGDPQVVHRLLAWFHRAQGLVA